MKRQRKRRKAAAGIFALILAMLLGGCGKREMPAQEVSALEVEASVPGRGSVKSYSDYMGEIEAGSETTVMPFTSGQVTATYFEEGDTVSAGDLMFEIDPTDAENSLQQAQATLTSANATLSSAEAAASSAQLNLIYTQAEITENLGKVETDQMELENKVASAKYALKEAEELRELDKQTLYDAQDAYDDLEDEIDDLKDDIDHYKKYKSSLEKVRTNYYTILNAADPESKASEYISVGELSGLGDDPDARDYAEAYIKAEADADSVAALDVMISSADSTISSSSSSKRSANDSKDSALTSQITAAINLEIQKNKVLEAEDSQKLAEKMLADYENYTIATIIAQSNANLASSNSSLISANANVESAKANISSAQASVNSAQKALDDTKVKAPVSGIVKSKTVNQYEMATSGMNAYVIESSDSLKAVFYVPEKTYTALSEGQEVTFTKNDQEYEGYITKLYDVVEETSGLYKAEASVAVEPDGLKAGMTIKITLVSDSADNAMLVPLNAVYYENENAYVYCIKDGKAVKTLVQTGITENDMVEIKSGVTEDTMVITSWSSQLKDGTEVTLKSEETEGAETEMSAETESTEAETEAGRAEAETETKAAEEGGNE
ncbi:MAG: efflux RND transporter periplasmic adaptor subunit [Lachnospiraceae bacterium]|nr:efflux RND transporter periplasmic adaptor subunit [Lachnospiraceae bacterium]